MKEDNSKTAVDSILETEKIATACTEQAVLITCLIMLCAQVPLPFTQRQGGI